MNIKCPNCETAYSVPDSKIGDKPRKMRCARCGEVFTVKRRNEEIPDGYQEFTGRNESLPKEFAFLKKSIPPMARPSDASLPNEAESTDASPVSDFEEFAPTPSHKATQPGFGANNLRVPTNGSSRPTPQPVPPTLAANASPNGRSNGPSKAQSNDEEDATIPFKTHVNSRNPLSPAAVPVAAPAIQNSADIFGTSAWETEAPLELGRSYAAPSEKSQRIGKIMAIFSGVAILLLFFVIYRNGWSLSLSKLPEQFAFAFSGAAREILPDEVDDLETLISERRLFSSGSKTYLLVTGTVFNNAPVRRSNIMLRARLYDTSDDLRAEVKAPCDMVVEDMDIKRTPQGRIDRLYRKNGQYHNCRIRRESSTVYQMIFETPPTDYSDSFKIEVMPIFAK